MRRKRSKSRTANRGLEEIITEPDFWARRGPRGQVTFGIIFVGP